MRRTHLICVALLFVFTSGCTTNAAQRLPAIPLAPPPEAASSYQEKPGWTAKKFMVAAAHPLAVEAGRSILGEGGSAIDAAIAVQMVLTLVEPQSSGIGGGAFLMHFDGKRVQAFDGRETAPAAASESLFQRADGAVMSFDEAMVGGRAVGVPGVLRMLELAHREHGRLPWASLFGPAIRSAEEGFSVSPRLAALIQSDRHLQRDPVASAYFYPNGRPLVVGDTLKNPALAAALREIAAGGAEAFYRGPVADAIVEAVRHHPDNPGLLSADDLLAYRAKERRPLCINYLARKVCGMPPPSSGGLGVAQMLGILETKDMRRYAPVAGVISTEAVHLLSEAGRLAYADRARYVADPDLDPLPDRVLPSLLDRDYLHARAALIKETSMGVAQPGQPPGLQLAWGIEETIEQPSTSHISIVDAHGNAIAMTSSIENQFGSRLMVRGFLLNNQLTDFSFIARDSAGLVANRVQPGKRPRSSMAPTLVLDEATHELVLSVGSPGGSAIINYVAKVLVGVLDWDLNLQQAINLPNVGSRNGPTELEQGRTPPEMAAKLKARGHTLRLMEQTSGVQGIMRIQQGGEGLWFGAADPRREGVAAGD